MATYARFSPRALHRAVLIANALRLMHALPLAAFVPHGKNRSTKLTTESVTEWAGVRRQGVHLAARTITGAGNYRATVAATPCWRWPCWTPRAATAPGPAASNPRSCSACPSWRRTSGNTASP